MYKISQIFSTLFFIGYFKWAPGTLASFFSIIIIVYLNNITNKNVFIFIFFCILLISLILIDIYSKSIKQHDAKEIVIDEFLGVYLIIIFSNNYKLFSNEYIKKYAKQMKNNISTLLNINKKNISIKATTNEKIGFIGKKQGIAAESIVQIKNV